MCSVAFCPHIPNMGSLAYIHHDEEIMIPRPLCARAGDVIEVVEFLTDVPLGFCAGALFCIVVGLERHGWIHTILVDGSILLARLYFQDNGLKVRVETFHGQPSRDVPYKKLQIMGCVVEMYPTGQPDYRILVYQPGINYQNAYELPFLSQKGPRA